MKLLALLVPLVISLSAQAIEIRNSSGTVLGQASKIKCGANASCSVSGGVANINPGATTQTGDGTGAQVGYLQNVVTGSTTALTAAQCGSTVVNSGAVVQPLPKGTTALKGCRYTFITANASNFDINPDDADQILVSTNAAGDAIRNATLGNSITLELISATQWAPVSIQGTYTDIN